MALLKTDLKLPEILPGISMELKDQKHVHEPVFEYLEALGPEAKEAVPTLIKYFGANPNDRPSIARVLGSIGPVTKDALPTLIEFMEQPRVRGTRAGDAVQDALRKISK